MRTTHESKNYTGLAHLLFFMCQNYDRDVLNYKLCLVRDTVLTYLLALY